MVSPSLSCSTVFFNFLARPSYLSFFSLSFNFTMWSAGTAKSTILQVLFCCWSLYDLVVWPRLGCMSKSNRSLCVSFSRAGAGLCIYYLLVWSNPNFLYISLWITLPTQSCLVLYSFCANLLHSLIMWLIVSSLPLHCLHLQFCYYNYYYLSLLTL